MESSADIELIIIATAFILFPLAGAILHFSRRFICILRNKKEGIKLNNVIKVKLLFIAILVFYSSVLWVFFFWMIVLCNNQVSPLTRVVALLISLPYFVALFTISYALGPAITYGGMSTNKMIKHLKDKSEKEIEPSKKSHH